MTALRSSESRLGEAVDLDAELRAGVEEGLKQVLPGRALAVEQVGTRFDARGGAIGLSLIHDRGMMARSIMEGGAYELRMIVGAMEEVLGKPFDSIRLSGGGAKSPLWNQIQSDVYGRPVERLRVSECTTLGAAILGAAGAGVFQSVEEGVASMVHPFDSIEPNMGNHAIYADMFSVFRATFLALRDAGIYDKVAAVQHKHWGE